jgi:hypothetical protein
MLRRQAESNAPEAWDPLPCLEDGPEVQLSERLDPQNWNPVLSFSRIKGYFRVKKRPPKSNKTGTDTARDLAP